MDSRKKMSFSSCSVEFIYMAASPPCRAVWMCIKELGIDVDMRHIDMYKKAEHTQPWFVKLNPQHTVPTINDDGFILWESRAILGYLVNKYGKDDQLYPTEPQKRALVDRMLYFDIGTLYKSMVDYFQPILYMGSSGDPQKANQLKSSLDYLDQYLEIEEYVAGDNLTIADLALLATVTHLEGVEWSYKSYENIFRWVTKLKTELPYYNECNQGGINMFKDWVKLRREQAAATAAEEAAKSVRKNSRT
ncbi:glutathione S-transferase 1-1-like [Daphnia pulicaria]|uniref:glutathione S-transferase 1-1-like n=1 Tax=Daphnia pulicaria TaxID=35523 RepID=UPI001EEA7AA8|nr:glutathione S-transferase 1-1-like [Daphnia pulicaria]